MNSNLVNYSNPYKEELFENISGVNYSENFDNHEDTAIDSDNSNDDVDDDNRDDSQDNSNIINEKTMVDYIEVNLKLSPCIQLSRIKVLSCFFI